MAIVFFNQPGSPKGELFVMLDAIWSNGTRSSNTIFSSAAQDITFSFSLDSNLKRATITAETPSIKGEWHINSTTPARYPSGQLYPSRSASLYFAPYNWWDEAIPSGTVSTIFEIEGTPFSFNGFGGHDSFLTAFSPWYYISEDWIWARMVAGPYTVVVWDYNSSIGGKRHVSAFLVHGETALSPGPGPDSTFTLSLLYNGTVSDGIINNATGFGFDFVEKSGKRTYSTDSNYTRFVDRVSGGEVGGPVYRGSGQSEQVVWKSMALPEL
ncbi:hypothetical protein V8E51_018358 [Hyaloscypha variabilis]